MLIHPREWKYDRTQIHRNLTINDFEGGYITNIRGQFCDSNRLLSSPNSQNFYIYFGDVNELNTREHASAFCNSINYLQSQAFQINSHFLSFIIENVDKMVLHGLLMPEFLSNININDATKLLRECYMKHEDIQHIYKFSELVEILSKNVQQSRYEQTIIEMARAYDGYQFYYPAFLDFRGRIYRSGIFHFHERDFARSLLLLVDEKTKINMEDNKANELRKRFLVATAFHYQKFNTMYNAYSAINILLKDFEKDAITIDEKIISFLRKVIDKKCKNIYQLLANIVYYAYSKDDPKKLKQMYLSVPITQDASASAYQIMSYYLLDYTMAIRTNLISISKSKQIEDIYEYFLIELKSYLKNSLSDNPDLLKVTDALTRKMVKGLFMPMIYGKTIGSTITDIQRSLSQYIVKKESVILASHIFQFWREKYSSHQILMKLVPLLGRFVSAVDRPVRYSSNYFYTLQDYRVMSKNSVYVYDKNTRKRRSVTLSFPSEKRDKRKTETSTFVNFIHQKDATIAIRMVELMSDINIPIYTVHDNFISNTPNYAKLPYIYLHIFREMDPPLVSINKFIYLNIIPPRTDREFKPYRIIPVCELREYLDAWERPKSETKKKWETNIERIIDYYSKYCMAVCGSYPVGSKEDMIEKWKQHCNKYKNFITQLKGNYCIHH